MVDALTRAVLLKREAVVESGQRFIRDRYDRERQLREYLALYDDVRGDLNSQPKDVS